MDQPMKQITLLRSVHHRLRYYTLIIDETLFGEIVLIKLYGSIKYKKPTRILKTYHATFEEAMVVFKKSIQEKKKKGYIIHTNLFKSF